MAGTEGTGVEVAGAEVAGVETAGVEVAEGVAEAQRHMRGARWKSKIAAVRRKSPAHGAEGEVVCSEAFGRCNGSRGRRRGGEL